MIPYAISIGLLILFGAVVFRGAPYVPTHKVTIIAALDMLHFLDKGDTVLDLGSGDGSVLLHAARRGYNAIGYELNPILVFITWLRSMPFRSRVRVYVHDFWLSAWPPETKAVFVFLAGPYMHKLKRKLDLEMSRRRAPLYVVSNGFAIPGVLPKKVSKGLYLYELKPR